MKRNKTFKKVLTLALSLLLVTSMVAGCGKKEITEPKDEIITENVSDTPEVEPEHKNDKEVQDKINSKNDKETVSDVVEDESTDPVIDELVRESFNTVGSYTGTCTTNIYLKLSGEDFGIEDSMNLDITSKSVDNITYDAVSKTWYTVGTSTVNTMGFETITETETWTVEDENGNTLSYAKIPNTNTYVKSAEAKQDLSQYINDVSEFTVESETDTEYVISTTIKYVSISGMVADTVGDTDVDQDYDIPVTYVIDKETNSVKEIRLSMTDDMNLGITMELVMTLEPTEEPGLEIPQEVIDNVVSED